MTGDVKEAIMTGDVKEAIDKIEEISDNTGDFQQQPTVAASESVNAEDTTASVESAYGDIIAAKDKLIDVYQTQVISLQKQIYELIKNGAVITDNTAKEQKEQKETVAVRKEAYETLSDLGREIGR